jgi:hypothetical protein
VNPWLEPDRGVQEGSDLCVARRVPDA